MNFDYYFTKKLNKYIKNLKFNSENGIGIEGAEKLTEGVSKLLNLTSLNLEIA
jgi:hypothetical protein